MEKKEISEKGETELVFILDRSASMKGLESDTIRGFHSMIERQKKQKGKVRVTVVLFDDVCEELYFRKKIKKIPEMTEKEYFVRGCTALLDAMGRTLYRLIRVEKEKKGSKSQVIFVIITDGLENSSREYTYGAIKKIIERQKKKGWEFLFLGANMDAVREAANFGISSDRSVTFCNDREGVALNYEVVGDAISSIRSASEQNSAIDGSWKEKIEQDYSRRIGSSI